MSQMLFLYRYVQIQYCQFAVLLLLLWEWKRGHFGNSIFQRPFQFSNLYMEIFQNTLGRITVSNWCWYGWNLEMTTELISVGLLLMKFGKWCLITYLIFFFLSFIFCVSFSFLLEFLLIYYISHHKSYNDSYRILHSNIEA